MASGSSSARTLQQQDHEEQQAMGYKRKGGVGSTRGQDYEVALCTLFFLRALRVSSDFFLACNHSNGGKFDDVVLFLRRRGDPDPAYSVILLQAKHKATVTEDPLTPVSPFRFKEYLESFKKIRNLWAQPLSLDRRRITFKDVTLVLYTNTGCVADEAARDVTDHPELQQLQDFLNTGGRLLRVTDGLRAELPPGPDTADFLGQLILCTRQMDVKTADRFLEEELCKVLRLTSPDVASKLASELKRAMKEWWSEEGRGRYLTADSEEWNTVLQTQMTRLNGDTLAVDAEMKLGFTVAALEDLDVVSRRVKMACILVTDTHQASVTRARLLRAQRKSLVLGAEYLEDHWAEVEALWGKSVCRTLALDLTNYPQWEESSQLLQRLWKAALMDGRRHLVVVATEQPPSAGWNVVEPLETWSALDTPTQQRLLSVKVQLQGVPDVVLRDIVGSSVNDVMTDKIIKSLSVTEPPIRLGEVMPLPLDYYVPRCLERTSSRTINIDSLENANTLVFPNHHLHQINGSLSTRVKICSSLELKTKDIIEGLVLRREKCSNSEIRNMCCKFRVQGIRGKIKGAAFTGRVRQFIPFTWLSGENVVVVEGLPGVGKSSYVTAMCSSVKVHFPEAWVVRVDLAQQCEYLKGTDFTSRRDVIEFLLKPLPKNNLERHLLEHALRVTGNVFLFLDAFDEINPDYTAKCCELLKGIAKEARYRQMVVTTRPVTTEYVEEALETKAFTLPLFSDAEQTLFFKQFFNARSKKYFQWEITSLRESAGPVIEVPLHCRMTAEVLLNHQDRSLLLYNDPWKRCLLFQLFVEQSVNHRVSEKYGLEASTPVVKALLASNKSQHLRNLQGLAVRKLMPEAELSNLYDGVPEEKLGLVVNTGESVDFEHRTFAEYFLGCWLSDNWRYCPQHLLRDVLFQDGSQFVAATLSCSLFRDFPLHLAVARGDADSVRKELLLSSAGTTDRGGRSALHVAAMTADCNREVWELLLDSGEDVNKEDAILGTTAVKFAEVFKNWEFIEAMLEKGASFADLKFVREVKGATEVLIYSIEKDLASLALYILQLDEGSFYSQIDAKRNSLLHIAAANDSICVMKELIEMNYDVNVKNLEGTTPLHEALFRDHTKAVKLLVENGSDPMIQNDYGTTPLKIAISRGNVEVVKMLIDGGYHKKLKTEYEETAMLLAAAEGRLQIVKSLMENGVETEVKDQYGRCPLSLAARNGHLDIVKLLNESGGGNHKKDEGERTEMISVTEVDEENMEKDRIERNTKTKNGTLAPSLADLKVESVDGIDLNPAKVERGRTALMSAAAEGQLEVVKLLIDSGVETGEMDEDGVTALMLAVSAAHLPVVRLLIENGVDVNARSKYGDTALILATCKGNLQVVKLLIDEGANMNVKDEDGNSVLSLAAREGHLEVVNLLLDGSETEVENKYGDSAMTLAAREGHLEVVKLLRERGVNKFDDSALTSAAFKGHVEVVKLLAEAGTESNVKDKDGNAALTLAAREGHLEVVELLIKRGCDVNIQDVEGDTALTLAAFKGHLHIVKLLIDSGVEVNAKNKYGSMALMLAAMEGHMRVVKLLLESRVEVNLKNKYGDTSLMWAAFKGHADVVRLLLQSGIETNIRNKHGNTALAMAAREGHLEIVRLLTESGVEANLKNKYGNSPLILACREGHTDVVKVLTDIGVEVNVKNRYGNTALTFAAREGHLDVVDVLLQGGAETNVKDNEGVTAAMWAAVQGHVDVVKLLLKSGCDVNVKDNDGDTALTLSAKNGHSDVVKLLISNGCDVNVKDKDGNSSLTLAAFNGHLAVAKLLTETGAETNHKDKYGDTALTLAAREGHLEVAKLLIRSGCDVNVKNRYGDTALTLAAFKGHTDVLRLLIRSGAQVNVRNKYGCTALMLATSEGHVEDVKFLVGNDSDVNVEDGNCNTLLALAAREGHLEVLRFLIENGAAASFKTDSCNWAFAVAVGKGRRLRANRKNKYRDTALTLAAAGGHAEVVKLLIRSGAKTDVRNKSGDTALTVAAREGHLIVVRALIERGAEIDVINRRGLTPLMAAASEGHLLIAKLLIESGAETNLKNKNGDTAMTMAAFNGHMEMVRLLIESRVEKSRREQTALTKAANRSHLGAADLLTTGTVADVCGHAWSSRRGSEIIISRKRAVVVKKDVESALIVATMESHAELYEMLIASGVKVNKNKKLGAIALIFAAANGRQKVAKLLTEAGVKTNVRNKRGDTPLTLAAERGFHDLVKLLLDAGAEANAKNERGNTALMLAAREGHLRVVQLLIRCGAETEAKNAHGDTALTLAERKRHIEVAQLLAGNRREIRETRKTSAGTRR